MSLKPLAVVIALLLWTGIAVLLCANKASASDRNRVIVAPKLVGLSPPADGYRRRSLSVPLRRQWDANHGYCGETSMIAAGMRYGQYTSQWTVRKLASPGVAQWRRSSQLLLGVNDLRAARKMHLRAKPYHLAEMTGPAGPERFLSWARRELFDGHVPIIGVFDNTSVFGGTPDPDYDHIVPVTGIRSPLRSEPGYDPRDRLIFSDNGLWSRRVPGQGSFRPFLFDYEFGSFPKTRQQASRPGGPIYSLRRSPPNYGTSITGISDPRRETVPVRLTSDTIGEGAHDERVLRHRPVPRRISLTASVAIPDPTRAYRVFLYGSFNATPNRHFAAHADRSLRSWLIPANSTSSGRWQTTIRTRSDRTRVFRAIEVPR